MNKLNLVGVRGRLALLGSVSAASLLALPSVATAQTASDTEQARPGTAAADSDIVITGIRRSIQTALETKRAANQVVDAITAEDAGKLPDPTVADVLQRVPGVQVAKTFGGAGLVVIRGLQSNRTEVDGHASYGWIIDSANGFNEQIGRNFGLASLSSNLVSRVEVFKSPVASQVEGGLGGVINSITYRASDFKKPTVMLSATGNVGAKGSGVGYEFNGFATTKIGDRLGVFIGAVYSNTPFYLKGFTRGSWNEASAVIDQNGDGKRDIRLNSIRSENFTSVDLKRFGIHGNLQYEINDDLTFRADTTYTNFATNRTINVAQFVIPAGASITNPVFDGNYVVGGTATGTFESISNPRFETIRTRTSSAALEYKGDRFELSGEFANTYGAFIQRNINFGAATTAFPFTFDVTGDFPTVTMANPAFIDTLSSYGIAGAAAGSYGKTRVNTHENALRIDGAVLFEDSALTALRFGVRFSNLTQTRNAWNKNFGSTNAQVATPSVGNIPNIGPASQYNGLASAYPDIFQSFTDSNFPGFPSTFIVPNSGPVESNDPTIWTNQDLINNPANYYRTNEKSYAAYTQADFGVDGIRGNIGLRVVRTDTNPRAFSFVNKLVNGALVLDQQPTSFKNSYTDFLPSANLAVNIRKDLIMRFSASQTMARQALDQNGLAPNMIISLNTATPSLSTVQSGNPYLLPTRVTNFDASLEWYFSPSGFISGTVFYKTVNGFPVKITQQAVVPGLESMGSVVYTTPINSDSGTIKGFEASYQHTFDFLPGMLSGLGVISSFTYVDGKANVTYPVSGTSTMKLPNMPLTGVSKVSYSVSGFYERQGFNFRVSWNWRGNRLFALQSQANGPNGTFDATNSGVRMQYAKAAGSLDASASYDINENINIVLSAQNLLPKSSAPTYFTESEKFVWRRDIGESRFAASVRVKF